MKKSLFVRLAVLLFTMATLAGCILPPFPGGGGHDGHGDGHRDGGRGGGHQGGGDRH